NRQNDGVVRRIDIKADDVAQLGDELRVIGDLEPTHSVRLQAVGPPDALYRTDADPDRFGHGCSSPMGGVLGRSRQGQGHHSLGNLGSQRREARGPRLFGPQGGGALAVTGGARGRYPYVAAVEDAREKLQYDLYYIKNYSVMLDLVILIRTLRVVLVGRGR